MLTADQARELIYKTESDFMDMAGLRLVYVMSRKAWAIVDPVLCRPVAVVPATEDGLADDLDNLRRLWGWLGSREMRNA